MRMPVLTLVLITLALGAPRCALGQARDPASRQTLVDMAYVLGEAHALRQVCEGANDQYWRSRMVRLVDTEKPDEALAQRLKDAFNTGYVARQGAFPVCNAAARGATSRVLAKGKLLAAKLAQAAPADPYQP